MFKKPSMLAANAAAINSKAAGDISSVFPSLSGVAFTPLPKRFEEVQQRIVSGKEKILQDSWDDLLISLEREVEETISGAQSKIPEVDFKSITSEGTFSLQDQERIKKSGVAVIRNVIPEKEARQYKYDLDDYIKKNASVKGFPAENPSVYEIYWSRSQLKARGHPNLLKAQQALMRVWKSNDKSQLISTKTPLSYADRLRIRPPGDAKFALGPHVDGGSVERWEDAEYVRVYDSILNGHWQDYDAFDYTHRLYGQSDMYNGASACSMLRMFQGWVSMSNTGPGEGTLKVCPMLKHATAYIILRPFFAPETAIRGQSNFYDETINSLEKPWKFVAPTHVFPNATMGGAQELNEKTHPHLRLDQTMISMPKVNPGDYVVWHCDSIHSVEQSHNGKGDSSVLYIPATPLTEINLGYIIRQRLAFRNLVPPPDFPGGEGEQNFVDNTNDQDVPGESGKKALGISREPFDLDEAETEGERIILRLANDLLLADN